LVDDPELGVFDDLPVVRRAEVRTSTPGQRVFDEDTAPKNKAADVFPLSRMTRTPLEAQPFRRPPRRVGSAGKGTICSLSRWAIPRSIEAAHQKAYSAVLYRRPTKVFQDLLAGGGANLRLLALAGASPLEGGVPIMVNGKIIGAIGVSGAASEQDAQVAKAGAEALAK
jgi:uncharacterized protein GlcG (DUF336 family)